MPEWSAAERAAVQRLLRAARESGDQQLQHRRQPHQRSDLQGNPWLAAVADQRRLVGAHRPDIPAYGLPGSLLPATQRFRWGTPAAARGDALQPRLKPG